GSTVIAAQLILRQRADESDAIADSGIARKPAQGSPLWAVSDYEEVHIWQPRQRPNCEIVSLSRYQVSDRHQRRSRHPELPPRRLAIDGPEQPQVDAVPQHFDALARDPDPDQIVFQCASDRDHAGGAARGPSDHRARQPVARYQVDVGSS